MPYAIQNQRTKKFVTGTDYRYNPPHQITSKTTGLMFEDDEAVMHAFKNRHCGKDYQIVEIEPISLVKYHPLKIFDQILTDFVNEVNNNLAILKKGINNDQT